MTDPKQPESEIARVLSSPASLMPSVSALFAVDPELELLTAVSGPKKETARIAVVPRPATIAESNAGVISRVLGWTLLAASTVILLIEIWNYVS